jgi:hypothetical protein
MRRLILVFVALLAAAAPARAQDDKSYDINFGFGWIFPLSSERNDFNTGWNFTIGGTFYFKPNIGISVEYNYDHMDGPQKTFNLSQTPGGVVTDLATIQSNQQIHAGIFDLVVRSSQREHGLGGYVKGGVGIFHRIVQLTSPSVGYITVCDPYWYVCYPTAAQINTIIGDRSSNDFGIDIGGGITFGHEAKFYVETRYHYVWGPTVNPPAGIAVPTGSTYATSSNASYLPLVFGIRF